MSFRIVKVNSITGQMVRSIPVIYSDPNEASADAAILNDRHQRFKSHYHFVVKAVSTQTSQILV